MVKNCLVFVSYPYNKYSIAVLTGALENDPRFRDLQIEFLEIESKKQIDENAKDKVSEKIIALANQYSKVVVGFSFHTPNVIQVHHIVKSLREQLISNEIDNVMLIAGGPHPSGDPLGTLELGIDIVVVGEGEVTLPDFLESYYSDNSFCDMRGLSYFDESGKYHYGGRSERVELSSFPAFAPKHRRFSPIEISRGCPWACQYCQTSFLMGGQMRHRSVDSIVKYATIAKGCGLKSLRFITPDSFAYGSPDGRGIQLDMLESMLKAVSEIYDEIYLGSFPSEVRPDNVTPEAVALLKKYCANDNVILGAQSGSQHMLNAIHRGHTVKDILQATEIIIEAGLVANIDFIFGMPGENKSDIYETIDLIEYLIGIGARVHSHTFMPLVGTPFSNEKPGVVDERTRRLLNQLRGKDLEYGDWVKQENIARDVTSFLYNQRQTRAPHLRDIDPLRPQ